MLDTPAAKAIDAFAECIADPAFPCVGAKSALARQDIAYVVARDLRCPADDAAILAQVQYFAAVAPPDAVFVSQVVLFPGTPPLDEEAFERALWQRLQALHALDASTHAWDGSVSDDPQSPEFSLSLGGRAFYVIGLHPGASRAARRFESAALVFNLHSQFEALRADGRYEKLRETILQRDVEANGSRNPMLAMHGVASEARQYSGRQVGADWRCPFVAQRGNADAR